MWSWRVGMLVLLLATAAARHATQRVRGACRRVHSFADRVRVHLAGTPPIIAEITPAAAAEIHLAGGGAVHAAVKATEVTTYPR